MHRHMRTSLIVALTVTLLPQVASAQDGEVFIEVLSMVDEATVTLDGRVIGTTPLFEPIVTTPGSHRIELSRPGFVNYEEILALEDGDFIFLEVDMIPFAGIVRVVSNEPGASVTIDDERVGTTPFEGEVRIGERTITVSKDQFESWTSTQRIAAGEYYFVEATLIPIEAETEVIITESTPWYQHWGFWTGAAVVIGGGIAAAVLLSEDEEAAAVDILIELPLFGP